MPKTKPNGADAIFRKIFDTVDHEESHINIIIYDKHEYMEQWSFGSDNFSHLETAGSVLEGRLLSDQAKEAIVHIRERRNGKNLLYRILFTKNTTHFLSAEESMYSDTTNAETKEENALPLQENHIYLDADFFRDDENKYFQNAETVSMEDVINKNNQLDASPFDIASDIDIKFYNLHSAKEFIELNTLFLKSVYGEDNKLYNLQSMAKKIRNVLINNPFKNDQNLFIVKNFSVYLNMLKRIGLDLDFTQMLLPLENRLRFISRKDNILFKVEIFFKDDLLRIYGFEGDNDEECTLIDESNLEHKSLKELKEYIDFYIASINSDGPYQEDLEKYAVENKGKYFDLEEMFLNKLYSEHQDGYIPTLSKDFEKFKKLITEAPFDNLNNDVLIEEFEDYQDILEEIGLYHKENTFYLLPPFEELKIAFGSLKDGVHFTFDSNSVTVKFTDNSGEEYLDEQFFYIDNEESIEILKGIIKNL